MNSSFSWKDFFQRGLVAFDEPLIDHKIALDVEEEEGQTAVTGYDGPPSKRKPPEGTKDALRQSFETAAKRRRPIAIFVDEAQHLGKVNGTQLQNQLDCIKSLADDTGSVIVLIGTYELLPLRNLSGQLIGRSLDIHFPRYRSTEKELSQFKNVLRTFQDALPFSEETDILLKHWEFCYERSIGCVGNLRLMLVRAVHAALWANAKNFSWKYLKAHAFSEAESYKMMLEAYEGESELASKPEQRTKLREMLGLDLQSKPKEVLQPNTPQEEPPSEGDISHDETTSGAEQEVQTGEGADVSSELKPVSGEQPEEGARGVGKELPLAGVPTDAACSTLNPVFNEQSDETTNRTEEGIKAEEASSAQASVKPLKRPKAESTRPFRRKVTRDRTGGPSRKIRKRIE